MSSSNRARQACPRIGRRIVQGSPPAHGRNRGRRQVIHVSLLRNLLRLAQLLEPDVEELNAHVREEEVVEERLGLVTAKVNEERPWDVVYQVGDHLRIGDVNGMSPCNVSVSGISTPLS